MISYETPNKLLLEKYGQLKDYIQSFGSVAVAFSSGVDSTFLLYAAKEALGDRVIAVTASSHSFPERELHETEDFCSEHGIAHFVAVTEELKIEGFSHNPPNRCYLCKREIFKKIRDIANENGISEILEGSNLDDNGDYRPGLIAIEELGIKSPLRHIGFTKDEIRSLSEYFGLPTWNKQSFACLASRFPYGEEITEDKLKRIELAEEILIGLGYKNERVRLHGDLARIEVMPEDIPRLAAEGTREMICERFRALGFLYVTLDLGGYKMGSMNDTLVQ